MPRSMYNHADKQEDKEKSYIELDSTETEIIKYLNDNYKDVILLVKSSAAMELDCSSSTRTSRPWCIRRTSSTPLPRCSPGK